MKFRLWEHYSYLGRSIKNARGVRKQKWIKVIPTVFSNWNRVDSTNNRSMLLSLLVCGIQSIQTLLRHLIMSFTVSMHKRYIIFYLVMYFTVGYSI